MTVFAVGLFCSLRKSAAAALTMEYLIALHVIGVLVLGGVDCNNCRCPFVDYGGRLLTTIENIESNTDLLNQSHSEMIQTQSEMIQTQSEMIQSLTRLIETQNAIVP